MSSATVFRDRFWIEYLVGDVVDCIFELGKRVLRDGFLFE
jgi:hypothetical protein